MKNKKKKPSVGIVDYTKAAYLGIRRMLFTKEIGPGQKFTYRDLAEKLEMSPTPVVQALKLFEFQGLVRHEPNRGYYTEPLDVQEAQELYELREIIEVSLIPETVRKLDDDGLQSLQATLQAALNASREQYLNDRLIKDIEYHMTLASLSGKPTHLRMLRHVLDLLSLKYVGNLRAVVDQSVVDTAHREVFEKVAARDVVGAQNALSRHIRNVKERAVEALQLLEKEKEAYYF